MSEKNILAYFKSPEEAQSAAKKLQALRIVDMSIDRFSRYPGTELYGSGLPFAGDMVNLSAATYGTSMSGESSAIMAAADPSSSGMSDGGQGEITGRDILLTIVVQEDCFDRAMKIVEDAGGMA
ncbi:hypothetical protein MUG84_06720 [Paenibacillus sp. KQZ6P-2]|uniref:Uncharacterized protein n=1 Tax=Paenibacillus mangrovi TaxID=2931978 RepID=A0A9X1WM58_9BACL|nr:hypothetical protein [Paenibacillus mangrovi]MCJ8011439.1 hypothetical protein [Paenibacillus mangrovi]